MPAWSYKPRHDLGVKAHFLFLGLADGEAGSVRDAKSPPQYQRRHHKMNPAQVQLLSSYVILSLSPGPLHVPLHHSFFVEH